MTKLLETKDKLIKFYSNYETYVKPALKFAFFLILYLVINGSIGYNQKISNPLVAIALALIGCLLPIGASTFLASVVVLLNLYALSAEVALIGGILFLLVLVIYFRFSAKSGMMALVTPLLLKFNIPYAVPVGTALLKKPYAIIPSICGTIIYFFLHGIHLSAAAIANDAANLESDTSAGYSAAVKQLFANKEMFLFIGLFIFTSIVVYLIRKSRADHAWVIANVAGVLIQVVGFFAGFLILDVSDKFIGLILGNIIALLVGFVIQFFFMNLDYARTERVQFEDDDYYYYVKAVPKKMVASKDVQVKKFGNTTVMAKKTKTDKKDDDVEFIDDEQEKITRQVIARELEINEDWLK